MVAYQHDQNDGSNCVPAMQKYQELMDNGNAIGLQHYNMEPFNANEIGPYQTGEGQQYKEPYRKYADQPKYDLKYEAAVQQVRPDFRQQYPKRQRSIDNDMPHGYPRYD